MIMGAFPSPAQDYVEKELDLNELCIRRRASTFLYAPAVAVCRNQVLVMATFWWLIAREAIHGDIVVVEVDGEFTVKRLQLKPRLRFCL
jgi:DNA polymerase V